MARDGESGMFTLKALPDTLCWRLPDGVQYRPMVDNYFRHTYNYPVVGMSWTQVGDPARGVVTV